MKTYTVHTTKSEPIVIKADVWKHTKGNQFIHFYAGKTVVASFVIQNIVAIMPG